VKGGIMASKSVMINRETGDCFVNGVKYTDFKLGLLLEKGELYN